MEHTVEFHVLPATWVVARKVVQGQHERHEFGGKRRAFAVELEYWPVRGIGGTMLNVKNDHPLETTDGSKKANYRKPRKQHFAQHL